MNEFTLIEKIKKKIPHNLQGDIRIGDDAGVLRVGARSPRPAPGPGGVTPPLHLFSTDAIVDGVDFESGKMSPENVGRKALAVNLSDIAAMGGKAEAFLVTLGIPKQWKENWILRFYDGILKLAKKYKVKCLGGDISQAHQFFASIAIWGIAPRGKYITRSGARPGDLIGVTGKLGGSILRHHYSFEPRLGEGKFLSQAGATAMIDISDGLVQDLEHILKASKVKAEIDLNRIPISEEAYQLTRHPERSEGSRDPSAASRPQDDGLTHALTDGEDFELLFTLPRRKKKNLERQWKRRFPSVKLSWIGNIIQKGPAKITWLYQSKTVKPPLLKKKGYSHFS